MPTPPPASVTVRPATDADLPAIETLLLTNGLPLEGVRAALGTFLVAEHAGSLVGVAGVEERGGFGLLRSTAVSEAWRSRGVGRDLVEKVIAAAEARGLKSLYLLTTTAERYFPHFGFSMTTRDRVPDALRETSEFQGACPASAAVMVRRIDARP